MNDLGGMERADGMVKPATTQSDAFSKMSEADLIKVLIANIEGGRITTAYAEEMCKKYTSSVVQQRKILDAVWTGAPGLRKIAKQKGGSSRTKPRSVRRGARTLGDRMRKRYTSARSKSEKKGYALPHEEGLDDFSEGEFTLKPKPFEADAKRVKEQESSFSSQLKGQDSDREGVQRGNLKGGRDMSRQAYDRRMKAYFQGTNEDKNPEGVSGDRMDPPGGPVEKSEKKAWESGEREELSRIQQQNNERERLQRAKFSVKFIANATNRMKSAWFILADGKPEAKAVIGDITMGDFPDDQAYADLSSEYFGEDILANIQAHGFFKTAYNLTGLREKTAAKKPVQRKMSAALSTLKASIEKKADEVEQHLVAFEEIAPEGEGMEELHTEVENVLGELNEISTSLARPALKASARIRVSKLAKIAEEAADKAKEKVEDVLGRVVKDVGKLEKMLGKGKGKEEGGEPDKGGGDKGLPMGKKPAPPAAPEGMGEGLGEGAPPRAGSLRSRMHRSRLSRRAVLRRRAAGDKNYDVVPPTDWVRAAHPKKASDPVAAEVENITEVQTAIQKAVNTAPTGRQGALRRRRGLSRQAVKGGSDEQAYYAQLYGPEFARGMVTDYVGKKENVQKASIKISADEAAVRMHRACELNLEMESKQMVPVDADTRNARIRDLYGMDDSSFEHMGRIVRTVQPKLELKEGHFKIAQVDGVVRGFIDGIRVAKWERAELQLVNEQIVQSSLKSAMDELKAGDESGAFDEALNARLNVKKASVVQPEENVMSSAVRVGEVVTPSEDPLKKIR